MSEKKDSVFSKIYRLYTDDFKPEEMDNLIKNEAPGVYQFYLDSAKKRNINNNKVGRTLFFIRDVFLAFLQKLSPIRRIIYTILILMFAQAFFLENWFNATFAFVILNLLLAFEVADKLTAKSELDVARNIQMNLMPQRSSENTLYDVCGVSEPAREVGGDYYDIIPVQEEKDALHLFIGDISGKGMAAALYMVQVQALLHDYLNARLTMKEIMFRLNATLNRILQSRYFLTATLVKLDAQKTMTYCRGGHNSLLLYRAATGVCESLLPKGIALGLKQSTLFEHSLELCETQLESGDIVFLYTDGVTERYNGHKEEYGEERLKRFITNCANLSVDEIKVQITLALDRFADGFNGHDDQTFIVLKVK